MGRLRFEMRSGIFLFALVLSFVSGGLFAGVTDSRSLSQDEQLILVGIGAFNDGFYDVAEKQFSQYVRSYPAQPKASEVSYLLGRTLLLKGKLKEAKSVFLKVIHENRNVEYLDSALFWTAQIDMKLGNPEEARKSFSSIVRQFPKFEWLDYSHYFLALLDLAGNSPGAAEASFKKTLLLTKREELIQSSFFWLGILSIQQKQYGAANGYLQTVCQNQKPVSREYLKVALFWLGEAQIRLGKFAEAKSTCLAFLERFKDAPLFSEVLWRTGFCEYQLGNLKDSIEIFRSFSSQFKDSRLNLYAHYLLGEIFLALGDHASSIKELNSVLTHPQGSVLWGPSLLASYWDSVNLGEMEEADRALQRLLRLNPVGEEKVYIQWLTAEIASSEGRISDAVPYYFNILNSRFREKALFQIGKGYFFENKYREAVTNLDILILEFPNFESIEEALFIKAEALFKSENLRQALETYKDLLKRNPRELWQLFAWTEIGNIHLSLGEDEKAILALKNVVDGYPQHPLSSHAGFQLGNLHLKRKRFTEASPYYAHVLKGRVLGLLGEAYLRLGEIFYQQEKFDKAFKCFETALPLLKENSLSSFLAHLEIGNLQRRWGRYGEAKKSYRVILDHSEDEELRGAAKVLLNRIQRGKPSAAGGDVK